MNQAYKLVWDELRGMLVVVAENSGRRCKKAGKIAGRAAAPVFALTLAGTLLAPMGAGDAWAGQVCQLTTATAGNIYGNSTAGDGSVACGRQALAGTRSVAIGSDETHHGRSAKAPDEESVAIGFDAQALKSQTVVIGSQAKADGPQSIAIGANVRASGASSVAIGGDDVGKKGQSGQLGEAWEAVNSLKKDLVEQGLTVPGMVQRVTNGDWYNDTTRSRGDGSVAIGAKATSTGNLSSAIGMGAESLGKASTALGTTALAVGEFSSALGASATAAGTRSSSYGMGTAAIGTDSVSLGTGAYVGDNPDVQAINDLAFAYQKELSAYDKKEKDGATATELQNYYTSNVEPARTALEQEIKKYATKYGRGVAVGATSKTLVADGVALGSGSVANRASANGGQGAGYDVRTGSAYVKGDDDANKWDAEGSVWKSTIAAVSVGSAGDGKTELRKVGDKYYLFTTDANGNSTQGEQVYARTVDGFDENTNNPIYTYVEYTEDNYLAGATPYSQSGVDLSPKIVRTRQITNVAAGSADTDAVNVAQLKLVNQELGKGWNIGGDITDASGNPILDSAGNPITNVNIKNGDQVQFVDGTGTTVTIHGERNADGTWKTEPSVAYNVDRASDPTIATTTTTTGTDPMTGGNITINPGMVTNGAQNQYWDSSQTQHAINNAAWRTQGGQATGGTLTGDTGEGLIHAGDLVKFEAGSGVTLNAQHTARTPTAAGQTTYTFAVNRATNPIVDGQQVTGAPTSVTNVTSTTNPGGSVSGGTANNYWDSQQTQNAINNSHWNIGAASATGANLPIETANLPRPGDYTPVYPGGQVGLIGNGIQISRIGDSNDFEFRALQNSPVGQPQQYTFAGNTGTPFTPPADNARINVIGVQTGDGGQNITVTATGNDTLEIELAEDIDLGSDGSVTMGNTVVDNGGVTIMGGPNNTVKLSGSGLDNGGNKIINVAPGTATTDAATVGQLTQVQAGTNVSVAHSGGNDGAPNVYTVSAAGVKAANDGTTTKYITVTPGTKQSDGTWSDHEITFNESALNTAIDNTGWTIVDADGNDAVDVKNNGKVQFDNGNGTTVNIQKGTGTNPPSVTFNVNEGAVKVDPNTGTVDWGTPGTGGNIAVSQPTDATYYATAQTVAKGLEDAAQKYEGDAYALNIAPRDQSGQSVNLAAPGAGGTLPVVGRTYDQADGVYNGTYYSSHNMQVVTARVQGSGGAPPRDILISQMSNNPTFRNRSGQDTVKISGDKGQVQAGNVVMGNQTPPSSSYVGNGGPNPATGNYVTGLDNKQWRNGNYVSGRAATEDQLQQVAESMDLSFSGDRNIWVGRSGNHVSIRLNPNVHVDSVTVNDGVYVVDGPSMTKQGINAAGTTITNVAPGIEETDAVNVGQLRRLEHKVNKMGDRADAGIAGAMAAAAVPQVTVPGANLLGAGAGYFHDQSAVAVGYSAMSDNGRWIMKANASVSTEEAAASAGVGYQW